MTIHDNIEGEEGARKTSPEPFSSHTTEWTIEDMMKSLPDVEDPPAVARKEPVTATTIAATHESPMESRIVEDEEQDDECPLLNGVPIDQLPPRFQRLLNDTGDSRMAVEFIPTRLPMFPLYIYIFPPLIVAIVYLFQRLAISDDSGLRYGNLQTVLVTLATFLYCGYAAFKERKVRAQLYAKDSHGVRKPWPGDWKIGVYLIGRSAMLDFDGDRAWLFPVNSIIEIDHTILRNQIYASTLVVRSPSGESPSGEGTFKHLIAKFERNKGKDIEVWHHRCTARSSA